MTRIWSQDVVTIDHDLDRCGATGMLIRQGGVFPHGAEAVIALQSIDFGRIRSNPTVRSASTLTTATIPSGRRAGPSRRTSSGVGPTAARHRQVACADDLLETDRDAYADMRDGSEPPTIDSGAVR